MSNRTTPQDQNDERKQQRAEASEMRERGTLTPESKKQGVTSHLPVEETEYMYRTEEGSEDTTIDKKDLRKTA